MISIGQNPFDLCELKETRAVSPAWLQACEERERRPKGREGGGRKEGRRFEAGGEALCMCPQPCPRRDARHGGRMGQEGGEREPPP